jgi:hypothetical protein
MTSLTEIFPAQRQTTERDPRAVLRDVMLEERRAYEHMRALVPDLALPMAQRRPLSGEQQSAVETYQRLRDRLEQLRSAHRSPGLAVRRGQSD